MISDCSYKHFLLEFPRQCTYPISISISCSGSYLLFSYIICHKNAHSLCLALVLCSWKKDILFDNYHTLSYKLHGCFSYGHIWYVYGTGCSKHFLKGSYAYDFICLHTALCHKPSYITRRREFRGRSCSNIYSMAQVFIHKGQDVLSAQENMSLQAWAKINTTVK